MGIEESIQTLTKETIKLRESVDENNALLKAGGAKASGGTTTAAAAKKDDKKAAAKSKYKAADIQALATRVQKEVSTPVAKELIKSTGAADLNDLVTNKMDKWDEFGAAAEAKLAPDETVQEDEDEL